MTTAMYPGTFDPITNGHLDIVQRASAIYDQVIVAIGVDLSRSPLFSSEERVALAKEACADIPNVRVISHSGLTIDAAREQDAKVLVRGLRAITDFTYEFDMALMNRQMAPEIESAFLMTSVEHLFVSASRIRELASFGRDVSALVPPATAEALKAKFPDGGD